MKTTFALSIVCLSLSLTKLHAQEAFYSDQIQKVWETPEGLNVPESAFYNADDKTIYVSNIVGKHDQKDGIGYISKLNSKGEFIEKEWVKGLNAPKGIGVAKGNLYVTDIDEVVEISLKSGKILKRYKSSIAQSFNDIATDPDGNVYVSEMVKHMVMKVGKDSLEVFVESDQIASVNGVCDFKNEIVVGSKGNMIAIDKKTKAIRILAEKTGYLDGIVLVGVNKFITSDWKGNVQLIELGKPIVKLLDTSAIGINAADLGFIPTQNLLLVPTFLNNKVIAYKLK
jgi:DNA-binding beta-propeller fold protein YncE